MTWTFIYLMLFLKLPIIGLLWLVWWAVHQNDEDPAGAHDDDGGSKLHLHPRPHPRRPMPRPPRRGPHGTPPPPSPARVRTVLARARKVEH
jgi:hypothetical protein